MKILVVSSPFKIGFGGGSRRNYFTLMNYGKLEDVDVTLVVPVREVISAFVSKRVKGIDSTKHAVDSLKEIEKSGVTVPSVAFELFEDSMIRDESWRRSNLPSPLRSIWRDLLSDGVYMNKLRNQIMNKYLHEMGRKLEGIDAIYSQHETHDTLSSAHFLSRLAETRFCVLLQLEPEASGEFAPSQGGRMLGYPTKVSLSKLQHRRIRGILSRSARDSSLGGILSVSAAPLNSAVVTEIVTKYRVKTDIITPPIAFDRSLLGASKMEETRGDAIFYARLEPSKGVLEIPRIWKTVTESVGPNTKLCVIGAFSRTDVKREFMELVGKLDVGERIEYLGFLPTEELYSRVSAAKVLVYPSHRDSFSMVILESLACGTPVVAYDIPAVKSVYGGLGAVKMVREGDMQGMAHEIVNMLKSGESEYRRMFDNEAMKVFLTKHSSWENVAKAEVRSIRSMLNARSNL